MPLTKAAMIQFTGHAEKAENIAKAKTYIAEAVSNGAKIVCLQELFNTIYFCYTENPDFWKLAEEIPGPTIDEMSKVAAEHNIVLVAPIYEKALKGELYNTAVVLGPDGQIMGKYRKSSIPLVKTASLIGNEKYYFKPGNLGFPVWQTPFGVNIGIMICYDRHFPEHARLLALNGADLVFVPTATGGMSRYLWEIELQAHAIDNIYYIGGVNRVGLDEGGSPTQEYYGSSFFADPKGKIISQAGDKHDEIIYAEIDLRMMEDLRNTWGFFRDRRPDMYAALAQ
jgi:beta-ureidopropionase